MALELSLVAHLTVEQLPQTLGHSMQCAEFDLTVLQFMSSEMFSAVYETDSDMSSRSAADKLFQTVGPLTVKLWLP